MVGHLPSLDRVLGITEQLTAQFKEGEAAKQRCSQFPVARDNPILWLQGESGSNNGGFFTHGTHVKPDSSLSLKLDHALINAPIEQHDPIQAQEALRADRGHVLAVLDLAIGQQYADWLLRHSLEV